MRRPRILVVGANGELGRALLHVLGPERAVAATRSMATAVEGFDHVCLSDDGALPEGALVECDAVINAAGCVTGDAERLNNANVDLPQKIALAARYAGVRKMVQVSSISVFGVVERIDAATPEQPINAYGRSKLQGDHAIGAFATSDFAVESVRLPFMFSGQRPGLLAPLLKLAQSFKMLPSLRDQAICRSMFTYADAARTLIECASDDRTGTSMAADSLLFDYPLLAKLIGEETGRRIGIYPLPTALTKAVELLLPGIGRRLFRSSALDLSANRARDAQSGLETELRAVIRNRYNP